ncbi:undecaprenyl diphosphate synthase [Kitasatospora sp. MAA4]|uniref:polyprenyl diphosphate synthase n=1 Tax=Kitasatospora sp. MAA4 TaxID=3035093 RepID=UPI002473C123|nr:polyprenyl diphosphate synthase [Kitasatospora sp. MAA4]MDH6135191.1 undecaprenyl diphosphate synthase [Kitasatospora sp. MAA4]
MGTLPVESAASGRHCAGEDENGGATPSGVPDAEMPTLPPDRIPAHVALVMDGNGRWAEQRGLARSEGHRTALARMFEIVDGALAIGVTNLSVFAFSSENWQRSTDEVTGLLQCCKDGAQERIGEILTRGIRFRWCGLPEGMPDDLVESLHMLEAVTASGTAITCNLCFNYGGRADIVQAARTAMHQAQTGQLHAEDLDETTLGRFMLTAGLPDVDLLIRTGGEQRLSNFMLWQSAYAEIEFSPHLWPDYTRQHLWEAIDTYTHRNRRFGGSPIAQ